MKRKQEVGAGAGTSKEIHPNGVSKTARSESSENKLQDNTDVDNCSDFEMVVEENGSSEANCNDGKNHTGMDKAEIRKDDKAGESNILNDGSKMVIRGLHGLKPDPKTYSFTLDFNVFNDLISVTYQRVCAVHPEYCEHISRGMFAYYCGTALWYRLYEISSLQGGDYDLFFPRLKASVETHGGGFVLPKPIHEFLNLIGDFVEPGNGFYWRLDFINLNKDGHFGKMSADTFFDYMAYPTPAVLIRGLRQELDVITKKVEPNSGWRLEEIDNDGLPADRFFNNNVCGYYFVENSAPFLKEIDGPIGKQLSQVFAKSASTEYQFRHQKLVNLGLQRYITNFHTDNVSTYPMEKYNNESKYGSLVQIGFVDLSADFFQESGVLGFSPVMLPSSLANLIPVLRLRAERAACIDAYPYNFSSIDDIPRGWDENLNFNFDYGDVKDRGWNSGLFRTGSVDALTAISEYVSHFSKLVVN